jgi:hypothetical protein
MAGPVGNIALTEASAGAAAGPSLSGLAEPGSGAAVRRAGACLAEVRGSNLHGSFSSTPAVSFAQTAVVPEGVRTGQID